MATWIGAKRDFPRGAFGAQRVRAFKNFQWPHWYSVTEFLGKFTIAWHAAHAYGITKAEGVLRLVIKMRQDCKPWVESVAGTYGGKRADKPLNQGDFHG